MQERTLAILIAQAGIASVINLCDTESGLKSKVRISPWYRKLYQNNCVIALGMNFGFDNVYFRNKLKKALQFIINTEGPWLIHCNAGVDRTGFVSMVLESLMKASIDEIANDYLESFNSAFDSSVFSRINNNDHLAVMQLLSVMNDSENITDQNLQEIAENYLEHTVGLTATEIMQLKGKLSGQYY